MSPLIIHTWGGGQDSLVVKHPPGNQKVGGSIPTAAMQVENEKWEVPCTEVAPMVHQDLSGRPADQS